MKYNFDKVYSRGICGALTTRYISVKNDLRACITVRSMAFQCSFANSWYFARPLTPLD
jgi:hypothetical protein